MRNQTNYRSINKKIIFLLVSICCIVSGIIMRLVYLQINRTEDLSARSKKNFLQMNMIASPRGNIIDRNGNLLATNKPTIHLHWYGSGNNSFTEEQWLTLHTLETILHKDIIADQPVINAIKRAERYRKKTRIAQEISFQQLSQIVEQFPYDCNLTISTDFKRYYPYKSYASHLLGYLGNMGIDSYGKMGLENLLDSSLQGEKGSVLKIIDSIGRSVTETTLRKALVGQHTRTTLDINIQGMCESVFPEDQSGAIIIMDPYDGSIVSLLSRPCFDPTTFLERISNDHWQILQEKKSFLNRALNCSYPPGSIFKLVTVSAALENGFIQPDATVNCKGFYYFGRRKYWCNRRHGHGELTLTQALAHSCNPLFFQLGTTIDIDMLAAYAHKFGLGQKTNFLFSETNGLVPTRAWKKENKGERWWTGETLSVAIGQSFLLTSPIQIARMISSIFTGYLVTPRILMHEPVCKQPLSITADTRKFLQKSMKQTVKHGTGKSLQKLAEIKVYAKTSTAQTSNLDKRKLGADYLEHGWFVANFSYKNNSPLTMVILVENAGTAQVATKVAKNFLLKYKQFIDKQESKQA